MAVFTIVNVINLEAVYFICFERSEFYNNDTTMAVLTNLVLSVPGKC